MNNFNTEAEVVANLAHRAATASVPHGGGIPYVVLPEGQSVKSLENLLHEPARKRGVIAVRDAAGFIAMVKRHATDATMVYRRADPPAFLAVIDDHGTDAPGWQEHRVHYACPLSTEWQTWTKHHKVQMNQETFAQFIEDNLPDIVDPRAADMLEISRSLQAKKKVNFASALRLDNGQHQLTYEEQVEGRAGERGQLRVPEVFKIGIPAFEGGAPYAVQARLRYRIAEGGKLTMWYDLERHHKVIEHAVAELQKLIEQAVGQQTINGWVG